MLPSEGSGGVLRYEGSLRRTLSRLLPFLLLVAPLVIVLLPEADNPLVLAVFASLIVVPLIGGAGFVNLATRKRSGRWWIEIRPDGLDVGWLGRFAWADIQEVYPLRTRAYLGRPAMFMAFSPGIELLLRSGRSVQVNLTDLAKPATVLDEIARMAGRFAPSLIVAGDPGLTLLP